MTMMYHGYMQPSQIQRYLAGYLAIEIFKHRDGTATERISIPAQDVEFPNTLGGPIVLRPRNVTEDDIFFNRTFDEHIKYFANSSVLDQKHREGWIYVHSVIPVLAVLRRKSVFEELRTEDALRATYQLQQMEHHQNSDVPEETLKMYKYMVDRVEHHYEVIKSPLHRVQGANGINIPGAIVILKKFRDYLVRAAGNQEQTTTEKGWDL